MLKTRLFSRNTVLALLCALAVVFLYTSGAFAQGTASIKAIFGQETAAPTSAVDPGTPEIR